MDVVTWTPERVERLTQLFEEGLPTAEIGRRLGLTKNAVIGKLHRIALAPRVSTPPAPPQRNFFEFNGHGPGCLWPHGHPDDVNFHFCGAHPLPGKPYCAEHAAVAYIRPREERAKAA
jgi:GcrA cell cycle regulator